MNNKWDSIVKVMNWGYWGSVGIVAKKEYRDRMAQVGVGSIEPEEGMVILKDLIFGPIHQMAYIKLTKTNLLKGIIGKEYIKVADENKKIEIDRIKGESAKKKNKEIIKEAIEGIENNAMEEMLCKVLLVELESIGIFSEKPFSVEKIITNNGLPMYYKEWLSESIGILEKKKYIGEEKEGYEIIEKLNRKKVWEAWEGRKAEWNASQVRLVEKCLNSLSAILKKKVLATDILFPNSSMELVEGVYAENQIADFYNEEITDDVIKIVQELIKEEKGMNINILEIGAGTGGTSGMLFKKLKPYEKHINEYCYTDISKAFLMHAEDNFKKIAPYIKTQIFNVELPLVEQGIEVGSYDIVLATNVLHATKNIRKTIRNTKGLLKRNGILLLNEISTESIYAHLTFGLLEGWWLAEDRDLRIQGSPGIKPDTWKRVLEEEGFYEVIFPVEEVHELGQQIIVGVSDGVIRQERKQVNKESSLLLERKNKGNEAIEKERKLSLTNKNEMTNELLKEKCIRYLKELISKILRMPIEKIYADEQLEKYGIDSIIIVSLTNALSKDFENISSTLLFEYQTIDAIVDYLLKARRESVIKMFYKGEGVEKREIITSLGPKEGGKNIEYKSMFKI